MLYCVTKVNKIYNQDCITGMKLLDDNSIDLVVTSPPYNIGIKYDIYKDIKPWNEYLSWCKEWLTEIYRVLKDDGRCCINHYINFRDLEKVDRFPLMDIRNIQEEIGFNVNKLIIWEDKTYACFTAWGSWQSASSPHIQTPYEGILISCKNQWKKINKGENTISRDDFMLGVSGVWKIGTNKNNKIPATFPIKLPQLCIELLSYKNDLVLDPFVGSGQTVFACKKTGRRFIGFEISSNYCKYINNKLKEFTNEHK